MARINHGTNRTPRGDGMSNTIRIDAPSISDALSQSPSLSGPDNADYAENRDSIIARIKQSYIYRHVYDIFSQESNRYWFAQLQGILDSVVGAGEGIFDDLGLSHASGDRIEAIYQEAINNIQSLYNQYQSYKNSLPVNQVQQYSVAGINSAITGQGVSGSSLEQRDIQSGASSMPSTNTGDLLLRTAEFALNATSGLTGVLSSFADVALKFKDLDLRERTQDFNEVSSFNQFKKLMADSGVILNSSNWGELSSKDPNWNDNASSRAIALHKAYEEVMTGVNEGPAVVGAIRDRGYSPSGLSIYSNSEGASAYMLGSNKYGYFLERDYGDLGKMQIDLAMAEALRRAEVGSINLSEGLTPEDIEQNERKERKANSSYNARKAVIFLDRLDKLIDRSNNGDPVASVELINLMQSADWQESAAYMLGEVSTESLQLFGSSLSAISSWNHSNFVKAIDFFKKIFN